MKFLRLSLLLACLIPLSALSGRNTKQRIDFMKYTLTIPQASNHYAELSLTFEADSAGTYTAVMPVWTPGSYLVREFSKSVEQFFASDKTGTLKVEKARKNAWNIEVKKPGSVTVYYKVYANEFSARTSYIDADQALINGASMFLFIEGKENTPGTVQITLPNEWKSYISSLGEFVSNQTVTYSFLNYDILIDAPIQLGNFEVFQFDVLDVPHYVAMVGANNANIERLKADMKTMCETMADIVGEFPRDIDPVKYVFIVQHVAAGGGGIEHLNSTVLVMPRFNYTNEGRYRGFLSLVAHEYFHLWNVKRIRPVALGPFDYNQENYTKSLWIAEGITSYYDELALLRAGLVDRTHFLNVLASYINGHENRAGSKFATLHDMSLESWIKEYRPNENSRNTGYSYYSKGFVIGALLDAKICQASNGKQSLDDVFKKLYKDFYGAKSFGIIGTGYTDEEFLAVCNQIAGTKLDTDFYQWLETTETPDYASILEQFKDIDVQYEEKIPLSMHFQTNTDNGKSTVSYIQRGGMAEKMGLNVNDELISLNGYRVRDNFETLLSQLNYPETIELVVSRGEVMYTLKHQGKWPVIAEKKYSIKLVAKSISNEYWKQTGPLQQWLRINP